MFAVQTILTLSSLSTLAVAATCPSNSWIPLAKLPSVRQEHSTIALNDSAIAVVGGVTREANGTFVTTNLFQIYNIATDSWSTAAPVPAAINHPNVAVVDGKVYVLGGLSAYPTPAGETVHWLATNKSFVYDPSTQAWTSLPPIPYGNEKGSADTGVYGEMIYLAGGMTVLESTYQDAVTSVLGFNTTSKQWQRLTPAAADLPEGRQHSFGAVINSTFYVVAGRFYGQMPVRGNIYYLDLENQEAGWSETLLQQPVPRGSVSGDVVNGTLYSFGGEGCIFNPSGIFNNTEGYNTVTQAWTELQPMAMPRHGTHAVAVGGKIYIPGGGLQQDGKAVTINGTTTYTNPTDYFDAYCV